MRAARISLMCTILFFAGGASALAQSESAGEVPKLVEQCIRDNAPNVERAIPSLTEGVNFLVTDLCAAPIAEDQERQLSARTAAISEYWKKWCAAHPPKPQRHSDADEETNQCATVGTDAPNLMSGWNLFSSAGLNKPPAPIALAAKVLLDLRIARMNATSTQGTH